MGRVLLAGLPETQRRARLAQDALPALTARTVIDADALMALLEGVREQGYALVDGELEEGVVSMAAPIVNRAGRVVAAINVSALDSRMPSDQMRKRLLPRLLESAASINTLMRTQD
jgi:IclR family pca regulon transcriptional regulator